MISCQYGCCEKAIFNQSKTWLSLKKRKGHPKNNSWVKVPDIAWKLITFKPLTDQLNDTDHGYSPVFQWQNLGPGIQVDALWSVKPSQTLAAAHPVASADGSVQWMLNQMEDDDGSAEFCRVETLNSLSRSWAVFVMWNSRILWCSEMISVIHLSHQWYKYCGMNLNLQGDTCWKTDTNSFYLYLSIDCHTKETFKISSSSTCTPVLPPSTFLGRFHRMLFLHWIRVIVSGTTVPKTLSSLIMSMSSSVL